MTQRGAVRAVDEGFGFYEATNGRRVKISLRARMGT
jgi:hypothetical protein